MITKTWNDLNTGSGQTPGNKSVSNSHTEIIASNSDRKWCYLTNIGKKDVWLAIGKTALTNKGLLLGKNGGSMVFDGSILSTEAINGITGTGSSIVIFQEGQ